MKQQNGILEAAMDSLGESTYGSEFDESRDFQHLVGEMRTTLTG